MNQENSALNFQLDQYRSILKNSSLKGVASVAVLTAGAVATYSNVADAKALSEEAQWTSDLKNNTDSITITGNTADSGGGKYEQLQLSSEKAELNLQLKSQQRLLISDTTHPYTSNSFNAKTNKLSVTGTGTIDVNAENAKSGDNFGMTFQSSTDKGLSVDVGNLNVQSTVQIGTSGDTSTASVSAANITIGNGKITTSGAGTDKKTYGQAAVIVGGSGGSGNTAFDGAGQSTFGNSSSNITVNSDGKLQVYTSKTDKKANSIQAANVSINGGTLSFEGIKDGKGSATYAATHTDVNDGYVAVKSGANLTISSGDFNLRGKSHMSIGDNLTVKDATLSVDSSSVLAGASGSNSAKITLEGSAGSEGTLKLDKNKLNSFLTGMTNGQSVQYADADEHYTNQKDVLKNAASGTVVLGANGGIEFTDNAVELSDLKLGDKAEAGSVFVSGDGFVRGNDVSISKNMANADKLSVQAKNIILGSSNFDSSSQKLGVKKISAQNATFVPNQTNGNYTLQDTLTLSTEGSGSIKGGLKITEGSLTINGGNYTLESGKDLIITNTTPPAPDGSGGGVKPPKPLNVMAAADPGQGGPDQKENKAVLHVNDASLTVSGLLETSESKGIKLNNGTLDARNAREYKIAGSSITLENASSLHLDAKKVLTIKDKDVELVSGSFTEKALIAGTNGSSSTVYLSGLGSVDKEQFGKLKERLGFDGFYDGFNVTGVESAPSMDFDKVEERTPDNVYRGTQVTVTGPVDKSVSVGSMKVSGGTFLEIGGSGGAAPGPDQSNKAGTTIKLTNAGANGNANRNFIEAADGSLAGATFAKSGTALQLQGTGNIASILTKEENTGALYVGNNEGTAAGHVTVTGNIGEAGKGVEYVTVQQGSELTVKGSSITTQHLTLGKDSDLSAPTATITITAGTKTAAGTTAESKIEGDLTAKELMFSGSGSHMIAGNATVAVDSLKGSKDATIQVGQDGAGGLGGTVIAKSMDLNSGSIFIDPEYGNPASYQVVGELANAMANDPTKAGTLHGKAVVGKNAVLAVGFDNKADVVTLIKQKLDANGSFVQGSGTENALVLNKGIEIKDGDQLVVDSTATSATPGTTDAVKFGPNSTLVITDKVYTDKNATKEGVAIDVSKANNKTVSIDNSTTVLLAGQFTASDKDIKIFSGAQNISPISVSSVNGMLNGTIGTDGSVASLQLNPTKFKENFGSSSKPVKDLIYKALDVGGSALYSDKNAAGAQFISKVATESKSGIEADRAAHAALFAGSQQAAMAATSAMSDAMTARAGSVRHERGSRTLIAQQSNNPLAPSAVPPTASMEAGMWATPNYKRTKADGFNSDGAEYGADIDMTGFTAGADMALGDLTVGAAASYGSGEAEGNGKGESLKDKFDYYGLGVYASVAMGDLSLIGDASYNLIKHDISGYSGFADFGQLSTSADTNVFTAGVTAKYVLNTPYFTLTPHFGTRFTRLETDSYDLGSSKGVLAQTDMDVLNIVSIPVGVGVSQNFYNNGWIVTPSADLTVTFNQGDTEAGSTTKLTGVKNALNMNTEIYDDMTYGLKVGVGASNGNFSSHVNVKYDGSENTDSFSINAGASYNF